MYGFNGSFKIESQHWDANNVNLVTKLIKV